MASRKLSTDLYCGSNGMVDSDSLDRNLDQLFMELRALTVHRIEQTIIPPNSKITFRFQTEIIIEPKK